MEHGAVEQDAVVGRGRERRRMEREAADPAGRQAAIERGRGIERPRIGAGLAQRVAFAVAGEGEHERRDERVDARLVDVPLVHAVLDDRSSGVQRGDVRGGRGGELRRELRDGPVGEHAAQERMAVARSARRSATRTRRGGRARRAPRGPARRRAPRVAGRARRRPAAAARRSPAGRRSSTRRPMAAQSRHRGSERRVASRRRSRRRRRRLPSSGPPRESAREEPPERRRLAEHLAEALRERRSRPRGRGDR